jgi:hypothetical protein
MFGPRKQQVCWRRRSSREEGSFLLARRHREVWLDELSSRHRAIALHCKITHHRAITSSSQDHSSSRDHFHREIS